MSWAWLTQQPIAHRGLHDRAQGRVENTQQAALAAVEKHFALECDVHLSADGEAIVFHDFDLERLTHGHGLVATQTAAQLASLTLKDSTDHIQTLPEFLTVIGGRAPVICEIKSHFDGNLQLALRVAEIATTFAAPLALASFDPKVIAFLRQRQLPHIPLGIIAQANYDRPNDEWSHLSPDERHALAHCLHYEHTRPDFMCFRYHDMPHAVPYLFRKGIKLPVLTWTIRSPEEMLGARVHADQIVFEGFDPRSC